MEKHPAIFLDRDGTIIEDTGYIKNPLDMIFYPESFNALRLMQDYYLLFIITNQPGIAYGFMTEDEVKDVNNFLVQSFKSRNIIIHDVFYCPHKRDDNCTCKKPVPYFINRAAELYNLNLEDSYIIGDHPSDVECGLNAGVKPIYLLTGHGRKHREKIAPYIKTCENIFDAARYVTNSNF